jgi:cytochrome c oxidase subunit 4
MSMHEHTITPKKTYFAVFGGLLVLTALTVIVAFYDLGPLNNVAALGIAGAKASLVIYFFMEVRHASSLVKLVVFTGLIWLAILLALAGSDYISRGWLGLPQGWSN